MRENILQMVKCCEHVNCILLVWITGGLVWANGAWARKAAFPAQAWLLASCLSHFHILTSGLRLRGMCPRDGWFPLEHKPVFHGGIPSLSTLWPRAPLPQIAISPHEMASCNLLFCLSPVATAIQKTICVSNSLKWRHLHTILKMLVRVLIYCFDQLSLTCGQSPQRSSKGKDPSRQTSASQKGRLPMDSCPQRSESTSKTMNAQSLNSSPAPPAQEAGHSNQKAQVRTPSKFMSVKGITSYISTHAQVSPKSSVFHSCPILRGGRKWCLVLDSRNLGFCSSFQLTIWPKM